MQTLQVLVMVLMLCQMTINQRWKNSYSLHIKRFMCMGDNFYHEMPMVVDGLPKSYLVKHRRDQLNKMCHISSIPGDAEGARFIQGIT